MLELLFIEGKEESVQSMLASYLKDKLKVIVSNTVLTIVPNLELFEGFESKLEEAVCDLMESEEKFELFVVEACLVYCGRDELSVDSARLTRFLENVPF